MVVQRVPVPAYGLAPLFSHVVCRPGLSLEEVGSTGAKPAAVDGWPMQEDRIRSPYLALR